MSGHTLPSRSWPSLHVVRAFHYLRNGDIRRLHGTYLERFDLPRSVPEARIFGLVYNRPGMEDGLSL